VALGLISAWSSERPRSWRLPSARLPRLDPELVVVIVTGAGSNQKGTPRATGCAATTDRAVGDRPQLQRRMPELFVTGELLAVGGRAVL
jgi:hypothetical protein